MHRPLASFICIAAMATLLAGCSQHATVLGKAPIATIASVSEAKRTPLTRPVAIQGIMVEKCPVAGCWFILRDRTGTIKVDTKAAGFTVVNVPLQSRLTVSGKLVRDGSTSMIQATGLTY
jgi:uncharacterized protein YdeI (BOF family)